MIDNGVEVNKLIKELRAVLPIEAYPTKSLYLKLKYENKFKIGKKKQLEISEILYLSDAGGICCDISHRNSREVVIVSITQLSFNKSFSLASKIIEYTSHRIERISRTVTT